MGRAAADAIEDEPPARGRERRSDNVLRVASASSPQDVAAAVSHALYDNKKVVLRAIGAGAVNQAVKALAIARGMVAPRGLNLAVIPGFESVSVPDAPGEDRTAITLQVITTEV